MGIDYAVNILDKKVIVSFFSLFLCRITRLCQISWREKKKKLDNLLVLISYERMKSHKNQITQKSQIFLKFNSTTLIKKNQTKTLKNVGSKKLRANNVKG